MGIDINHPKEVTKKAITDLINASIPSLFTAHQMIEFLEHEIERIDKEWV